MAIGWVVIEVPIYDRTLYGGQTRNRSRLKGHVGSLRGFSTGGGGVIRSNWLRQSNATHAMQGSVQAFPIKAG